jgi:hypothetical protein
MKHATWDCAVPNCVGCILESQIIQVNNKLKEVDDKSTGWYMYLGMRAGFKALQKELSL